jgi:hypothetical protein
MTSARIFPPATERSLLDAGVLRRGILALIALIVGTMFTYDLVRPSPRTPLPRSRSGALGAASAPAVNPGGHICFRTIIGATYTTPDQNDFAM